MNQRETALARLERNRLLYLDMLEVLRRGTAQVRRAGEDGVLLYDPPSGCGLWTQIPPPFWRKCSP